MLLLHGALSLLLLAAGLFLPGWLLGRALRTPAGPLGAFLGSAALLLNLVLLLDTLRVALTAVHLGLALALLCGLLALVAARAPPPAPAPPLAPATAAASPLSFRWQRHHWFFLPAALGLAAITLRATVEPLSGFDAIFRWDFLAHQMLRTGSLAYYPPVTSVDYLSYGWPDGIAPLVSTLYLGAYLVAGHTAPWVTAPVVVAQGTLLFFAVWQLAAPHDRRAAALACALLATSSVLLWGVAMGQETGLTALSLVAMFVFLDRHRAEPQARWLVWAGLAAGVGALAREYGLAYLALGLLTLAWWRLPRRTWPGFVLPALAVALPWYLRNWHKTGNPLYCHTLGGLFPGNQVLSDYYQLVSAQFSLGHAGSTWPILAALVLGLAGLPLVLGALGAGTPAQARIPWTAALLTVFALWLWSLGQTSAGPGYAVRLLTPAVALGAALGGFGLARFVPARTHWLLLAGLTLASLDAGLRSLYLPIEAAVRWWERAPSDWRVVGLGATAWRNHSTWTSIAEAADGRGILVPHPVPHAILTGLGAVAVPHFSPAVGFLFAADANFDSCLARLRAGRLRFIMVMRLSETDAALHARYPFFRTLRTQKPAATTTHYLIYDLAAPGLPAVSGPP